MKTILNNIRCLGFASATLLLLIFTGCESRSISNSDYQPNHPWQRVNAPSTYHGELKEADVLGIERDEAVTEEQIVLAKMSRKKIHLQKGSSILLIQSGAEYPDAPMIADLQNYFTVVPFSGVPEGTNAGPNFSRVLRLAAARGGCDTVISYWGVLESSRDDLSSKSISWVPIVGNVIPDENQHMRIRLKMALVDVATGSWTMFSPAAFQDTAMSAGVTRKRSDQIQVHKLKAQAYEAAATDLVKTFSN
jgi:hypothetical protein